jgi:hypothetical protein
MLDAAGFWLWLNGDLLEGEMWDVRSLVSMLNRQPADVPLIVDIQQSVLIEIASFCDLRLAKLDVERVGVLKILNLHG